MRFRSILACVGATLFCLRLIAGSDSETASLRTAAEGGDSSAQYSLALRYEAGEGISKNQTEAAHWFRSAAMQGHAESQLRLVAYYIQGWGVLKDEIESYAWLNLAAVSLEQAREIRALKDKNFVSRDVRSKGQQRSRELQQEIDRLRKSPRR